MKYECGHSGCDICGKRNCLNDTELQRVNYARTEFLICISCLTWAVNFAYEAACHLGGTCIDHAKPCARKPGVSE